MLSTQPQYFITKGCVSMLSNSISNSNTVNRQNFKLYLSENIVFPEHIEIVSADSFSRKNKLASVRFSKNIRIIGTNAFRECCVLQEVIIPPNSHVTKIRQGCFAECTLLSLITLSHVLREIEGRAFFHCKKLSDVTFPKGLRKIGDHAFAFCPLKSLELPDSLEVIEDAAFFKCNFLLIVTIPKNVKYTITEGKKLINPSLEILAYKKAFIPTDWETENYVYEYRCRDKKDNEVLIYIDPVTGEEKDILILLYTDGGVLTK